MTQNPLTSYIVTFQLPGIDRTLFKVGTGTGARLGSTLASIKRVGGAILDTFKLNLISPKGLRLYKSNWRTNKYAMLSSRCRAI